MQDHDQRKMFLLDILKGKWRIIIIEELFTGTKQFNELISDINGISAKTLTENLNYLVKSGIIQKKLYPTFPHKVEYSLSDTGRKLKPVLNMIYKWSMENYVPFREEVIDEYQKIFIL